MQKSLGIITVLGILTFSLELFAMTKFVTTAGSGTQTGADWTNSSNLQDALLSVSPGDNIWLASGNYIPGPLETDYFDVGENISILGGFNGTETLETQRDWVLNPTILTGEIQDDADSTNNTDRLLLVSGNFVVLSGLIFENADGGSAGAGFYGVGIQGTVIEDTIFRNNKGGLGGGFQINSIAGANTMIINSVFIGNEGSYGGAAYLNGVGGFDIVNSLFIQNEANIGGAAVLAKNPGLVIGCTFYQNVDPDGITSGSAGQLAFGNSGTGTKVYNSIFLEPNNTDNLSAWDGTAATILYSHLDSGTVGTIGTGNPGGVSLSTGTSSTEGMAFSDNVNFQGPDMKFFTPDDGLALVMSANAINAGTMFTGATDKDILGNTRDANPDIGAYEFSHSDNLNNGLVAHYRFEGNTNDSSVNGYDGMVTGTSYTTGVVGQAIDIALTEFVSMANTANNLPSSNSARSVSFWAYPNDLSNYHNMVSMGLANANGRFSIRIQASTGLLEYIGQSNDYATSHALSANVWQHIVVTHDGSTMNFYADGSLVDSNATSLNTSAGGNLRLGVNVDGSNDEWYDGALDEVRIYDRVLSSSEIALLYNEAPSAPGFQAEMGFAPPSVIGLNAGLTPVLIWDMDTMSNGYNGSIDEMMFDVFLADPGVELSNAIIYDLTSGNLVSSSPIYGSDNIRFTGLSWPINSGTNTQLELKVATGGTFSSTNIMFDLDPVNIKLADSAAVIGSPISSSVIQLDSSIANIEGLSFSAGPNVEPTSFTTGTNQLPLIDARFQLANGSVYEVISGLKINFAQGIVGSDIDNIKITMGGNIIGDLDNIGSGFASNLNLSIPVTATTDISFIADILNGGSSGNLEYSINGSIIVLANGNLIVTPAPGIANLGPVVQPSMLPVLSKVIRAGERTFYAISSGNMWNSGANDRGQLGRSGDPFTPSLSSANNLVQFDVGTAHVLAINNNGDIVTWGANDYGQSKGDGSSMVDSSIGNVIMVTAGAHSSYAFNDAGELWVKGRNNLGQLGLGDTTDRTIWTKITNLPAGNVQKISAGVEHAIVQIDNALYGFGSNGYGQLSQNSGNQFNSIVVVNSNPIWTDVECGGFHTLAIANTGVVYAGGKNTAGQLGLGYNSALVNPPEALSLSDVKRIAGGFEHSLFLVDNNTTKEVHGSGSSRQGQLGQVNSSNTPVQLGSFIDINEVSAGPYSSMILRDTNDVYSWGQQPDWGIQRNEQLYQNINP